ncbi:transposase [Clostridium perfringens]|uniref:transposase n=1 Tax=Clostridium perfringens TaxID=1502 RepID=UPI0018E49709|nr:transposase [Clostridium perfringens]MBI6033678.1 transposase [Clostridium perfringens]
MKKVLKVKATAKIRVHSNSEIEIQKIYQKIARYYTDYNSDKLKVNPVFKAVLGKTRLVSQPTISRFNNGLDKDNIKDFQVINSNYYIEFILLRCLIRY